ncbi:uncharacterized protein LOC108116857 [Drosophila eugracilis]|uniref:uncharacterized protein LOC108116857 n=1 Tax=Drosophila eugracilis TaxID=29029 RepID=UPI001BDAA942|nr:uncharacterized protein LOC108116857 [Drosophila eugracilis]
MSDLVRFLLLSLLCISLAFGQDSNGEGGDIQETSTASQDAARGLASSYEPEDKQALRKNSHIFMGIYKNYKSTYLGNKTTNEYKKRLRDRVSAPQVSENANEAPEPVDPEQLDPRDTLAQVIRQDAQAEALMETQTESPNYDDSESLAGKKRRKRKRKDRNKRREDVESETDQPDPYQENESIQRYHVGPGLNVSLDMSNDIVHVKLDGENLKEIIGARWLTLDNSEEGRGKKYDMITKVLPLFILPFLIQSAIVPFLVTKLKLLLVKSILVGKLAIFLLIISAIKNGNKMVQSYEVPSYWAGEPSRRSELAAAASSAAAAYNGYRVEGKPTTWIS